MLFKSTVVCCLILILAALAEGKHARHKNSTKWKQHAAKHKLSFKHDDLEMTSYSIFILFFLILFEFDCYFFTKRFDNFEKADQVIEAQNSNPNRKCSFAHNEFSHLVYNLMELFLF